MWRLERLIRMGDQTRPKSARENGEAVGGHPNLRFSIDSDGEL
ncbi:MAG TPA: hypothetical protein VH877_08540 [Polyangia bacterium]|jgi:hypothetical protein|nr:hypothetical protein [Polyangia bacterium]